MKTKSQFATIILILLFVLLFLSCNDSLVTENITQEKKPNTALNKQSSMIAKPKIKLPQFRHDTDTTNSNGTKAPDCRYRYVHGWSIKSYSPKPNKYLGVWGSTSPVTWEQYFNKYGFLSVVVSNITAYNIAKSIGFADDNMMVNITNYSTAYTQINSMNQAKYFLVDEPFERIIVKFHKVV